VLNIGETSTNGDNKRFEDPNLLAFQTDDAFQRLHCTSCMLESNFVHVRIKCYLYSFSCLGQDFRNVQRRAVITWNGRATNSGTNVPDSHGGYSGEWSPMRRGDHWLEPGECHPALGALWMI
jgi:hypothetical protein